MGFAHYFSIQQRSHCFNLLFRNRSASPLTPYETDDASCPKNTKPRLVGWDKLYKHIASEQRHLDEFAAITPAMCLGNRWKESNQPLLADSFRHSPLMSRVGVYRIPSWRIAHQRQCRFDVTYLANAHSFALWVTQTVLKIESARRWGKGFRGLRGGLTNADREHRESTGRCKSMQEVDKASDRKAKLTGTHFL